MGKVGKGKTLLSVSAPQKLIDVLDTRANALRLSRASYTLAVLEKWYDEGCPPVIESDRAMQHLRQLEKTLPAAGRAPGKGEAAQRKAS